ETPSTKTAATALARIVNSRHVLLVAEREDVLTWKSLRNVPTVHLIAPDQLNTYDVLVSDDVLFTEGALAAFLNHPGSKQGRQLGEAVETLATEPADRPAPVQQAAPATKATAKKAAPAKTAAAEEAPAVSETPATDAGTTQAAGAGVSAEEMAGEVAEQTSPDLKAEEVFEEAAGKDTDEPAETALADELLDTPEDRAPRAEGEGEDK
ncbi:MAG: large subunit ribosomal protein, partial [Frankiaceae bacterium]|nr:large subunit ribosomal protein [Frankiaceae bacterium]